MNTKEELIKLLNEQLVQLEMQMPFKVKQVDKLRLLITATEQAIFDLPSEEEIRDMSIKFEDHDRNGTYVHCTCYRTLVWQSEGRLKGFQAGCNFILNY